MFLSFQLFFGLETLFCTAVTGDCGSNSPVICGLNTGQHMYLDASPACLGEGIVSPMISIVYER